MLEQCVSELTSFQELALFGKNPHFILAVEADGEKDGCSRTIRQMVRMSGSYQTTAHMAVMTMERLLRNTPPPGVYWAFELLESSIVFREFSRLGCAVCAPWQEWHPEEGEIV